VKLRYVILALAPFPLFAIGLRLIVPKLGDSIADTFTKVAPHRASASATSSDAPAEASVPWTMPIEAADDAGASIDRPAPLRARDAGSGKRGALFVPARRARELAPIAAQSVHGAEVSDADGKPLGVRLFGVGALGVGLADGDVVTSIAGAPTLTVADATSAIVAAAAPPTDGHTKKVSAHVLRATKDGPMSIVVTVEVPTVK
jgi:hypothetical protein